MTQILRLPEAVEHDPAIDVWLNERAPGLGAIARTWFTKLRACGPDVRELRPERSHASAGWPPA